MASKKDNVILAADIHLTADNKDAYRWDITRQLVGLIKKRRAKDLYILGDLTEKKDHHGAKLVNNIMDALVELADALPSDGKIYLLRGNHDGIDPDWPFFKFSKYIEKLIYVESPTEIGGVLMLPYSSDPTKEWAKLDMTGKIVMTHVTIDGAETESGFKLESKLKRDYFEDAKIAFSGDIHKPQICGSLIYVGAPYNVRFADNFDGNVVLLNRHDCSWERVPLDFPRKLTFDASTVEVLSSLLRNCEHKGSFVKIRFHIDQSNMAERDQIKRDMLEVVKEQGFVLMAFQDVVSFKTKPNLPNSTVSVVDFDDFCNRQGISEELVAIGKEIIKEVP